VKLPNPTPPYPNVARLYEELFRHVPLAKPNKSCEERAIDLDRENFNWPGRYALAAFQRTAERTLTESVGHIAGWADELMSAEPKVSSAFNDDPLALGEVLRRELRKRIHRYAGLTRAGKPVSVVAWGKKYVRLDVLTRIAPKEPKLADDTWRAVDEAMPRLGLTPRVGDVDERPGREPAPEKSRRYRDALAALMKDPPRSELLFRVAARYRVDRLDRLDLAGQDEPGVSFAISSRWRDGSERLHPRGTLAGPLPAGARGAQKAEWLRLQELQRTFLARMQERIVAELRVEQALEELIRQPERCELVERAAGRPLPMLPPRSGSVSAQG
jgi:hypothetical protein